MHFRIPFLLAGVLIAGHFGNGAMASEDSRIRRQVTKAETRATQGFWNSLQGSRRSDLDEALQKIVDSPTGLLSISQPPFETEAPPNAPVFVIVHGLLVEPLAHVHVFDTVLQKRIPRVYLFKWSLRTDLRVSAKALVSSVRTLGDQFPAARIVILGHSAGGALASLAFDLLREEAIFQRLDLHTFAAPLFGYGAPNPDSAIATSLAFLFGKATLQIGSGIYRLWSEPQPAFHCTHWITVDCSHDLHACLRRGRYPQTGEGLPDIPPMPCDQVMPLKSTTHLGVFVRGFHDVLGRYY